MYLGANFHDVKDEILWLKIKRDAAEGYPSLIAIFDRAIAYLSSYSINQDSE
jgi:hypothetical protein